MPGPTVEDLRSLAAEYRSRAEFAEPGIARILREIAEDLEEEARKLRTRR